MDLSTIISTVVGVIAGGLINAYFSWQASKELRREAGDLRQLNYQLIRFLEDAGMIKNVEWRDGKPIRMLYGQALATGRSSASATGEVIHRENQASEDG